jgi:hypothetical protein
MRTIYRVPSDRCRKVTLVYLYHLQHRIVKLFAKIIIVQPYIFGQIQDGVFLIRHQVNYYFSLTAIQNMQDVADKLIQPFLLRLYYGKITD